MTKIVISQIQSNNSLTELNVSEQSTLRGGFLAGLFGLGNRQKSEQKITTTQTSDVTGNNNTVAALQTPPATAAIGAEATGYILGIAKG
jgi:hypothetical protein